MGLENSFLLYGILQVMRRSRYPRPKPGQVRVLNNTSPAQTLSSLGGTKLYRAPDGNLEHYYRDVIGRGEHHFTDTALSSQVFDSTGLVTLLNDIAEGTSTQERTGRKIAMTGVTLRSYAVNGSTATSNKCCVLLVEDLRPGSSLPAVSDILESANSDALNNEAGFGRFKIHMRKTFILRGKNSAAALDAGAVPIRNFDKFKPLKNRETHYSGSTGSIGQIIKGALYLVTVGNNGAGTGAASLEGSVRIAFKDIHW
jgi:hypothetical protein